MPSDKIQHLAVAIKGLERKITEASNEIDRKYPHVPAHAASRAIMAPVVTLRQRLSRTGAWNG